MALLKKKKKKPPCHKIEICSLCSTTLAQAVTLHDVTWHLHIPIEFVLLADLSKQHYTIKHKVLNIQ